MQRRHLLGLTAGLALPALAPRAGLAQGKDWPQAGSIRLIAQFPPGGLVDTIARLILRRADAREIEDTARAHGHRSLIDEGYAKAAQGLTSIEEVMRVTLGE